MVFDIWVTQWMRRRKMQESDYAGIGCGAPDGGAGGYNKIIDQSHPMIIVAGWTYLDPQVGIVGHHSLKANADALDNRE